MERYGIIGKPLGHSFSRNYFTEFFQRTGRDAVYEPYVLESIEEFPALVAAHADFVGLNVTIPYKQAVMRYLDAIDPDAEAIGAVNVVKVTWADGRPFLTGYNTDILGFTRSIRPLLRPHHTCALILGTGGASKAVEQGLRQLGIETTFVSRTRREGILCYEDLTPEVLARHGVVVNATPLGTFPDTECCPDIPYPLLTPRHLCFDLVYNPDKTLFLRKAEAQGAAITNGLEMLHIQADEAWKIWSE
ncbi:MAG: shikimate dehydrogenase [Bacteroidaceae bacterium]|nr:shikimate dehydrogenase [Bacteroidaceae bacterium]